MTQSAYLPSLVQGNAATIGACPGVPSRVTVPSSVCASPASGSSKASPSSPLRPLPLFHVPGSAPSLLMPALGGFHSLAWHGGGM